MDGNDESSLTEQTDPDRVLETLMNGPAPPGVSGWTRPGALAALVGGLLALVSAVLLPLHLGGGMGLTVGIGFSLSGLALAGASMALGASLQQPHHHHRLRSWAFLGAAGFVVSSFGLLADLLDWPVLVSEIIAIFAVSVWWFVMGSHLIGVGKSGRMIVGSSARSLGFFCLVCAALSVGALTAQFVWSNLPPGAAPGRLVYLLWGPWGLWLAGLLARQRVLA